MSVRSFEIRALLTILLAGALLRAIYLSELIESPYYGHPVADAAFHDYWARGLATGDWQPPEDAPDPHLREVPFLRPPGYSTLLALVYRAAGPGPFAPRIFQMMLGLANVILALYLAKTCFGPTAGLMAAVLMAFYSILIYFEGELQPPVVLISIALLLMILLRRWLDRCGGRRIFPVGVALGAFALFRPNVLLFAPVLLLWVWWALRRFREGRRFPRNAMGLMAGLALMIAPVTLRNFIVAGDFVLISCNGAVNLYIGNNEASDGVSPTLPGLKALTGSSRWSWFSYTQIVRAIEEREGRTMSYSDASSYFNRKAFRYIVEHPSATVGRLFRKALLFWGPAEVSNNKVIHEDRLHSIVLRHLPGFPWALSLGLLGLGFLILDARRPTPVRDRESILLRRRTEISLAMILFVGTYFSSFLPFLAAERFRAPVIPFLLLFGAYGISRVAEFVRRCAALPAVTSIVAWGMLLALSSLSFVEYEPDRMWWHYERGRSYVKDNKLQAAIAEFQRALRQGEPKVEVHYELARALAATDRLEAAAEQYREALRIHPGMIAAYNNLGTVYVRLEKLEAAIVSFREGIRRDDNDAMLHRNLALALSEVGRVEEALGEFRRALDIQPADAETHYRFGLLLERSGRQKEARDEYRRALRFDPRHALAAERLNH